MKRGYLISLGVLLLASVVVCAAIIEVPEARTVMVVGGGAPTAASCTTSNDTTLVDYTTTVSGNLDEVYMAIRFTLGSSSTITQYVPYVCTYQTSGTIRFSIYTNDGTKDSGTGAPGTQVTGSDITQNMTAPSSCGDTVAFASTLASPLSGLAAGTYWLVSYTAGGELAWGYHSGTSKACIGTDGTNWTCYNDTAVFDVDIMGCQP